MSSNLRGQVELSNFHQILSQGSHRGWKSWKMKVVMEKSLNMKKLKKVLEFCDKSWNCTKFKHCLQKLSILLEHSHFPTFFLLQNVTNLSTEAVMENQETVMKKSWKIFLQSLWEPCTNFVSTMGKRPPRVLIVTS